MKTQAKDHQLVPKWKHEAVTSDVAPVGRSEHSGQGHQSLMLQ